MKNRKPIIVISLITLTAVIISATILIFAINSSHINPSGKTNDATAESIIAIAKEKLKDPGEDTDVSTMSSYLDDVLQSYSNGNDYQQLSKEDAASIYTAYGSILSNLVGNYSKYAAQYTPKLLECYHKADELIQTAKSAENVYYAEISFGSTSEAKKYKQIAIDRGSTMFNSTTEGQG